jgi:hypothetical protein
MSEWSALLCWVPNTEDRLLADGAFDLVQGGWYSHYMLRRYQEEK